MAGYWANFARYGQDPAIGPNGTDGAAEAVEWPSLSEAGEILTLVAPDPSAADQADFSTYHSCEYWQAPPRRICARKTDGGAHLGAAQLFYPVPLPLGPEGLAQHLKKVVPGDPVRHVLGQCVEKHIEFLHVLPQAAEVTDYVRPYHEAVRMLVHQLDPARVRFSFLIQQIRLQHGP